MRVELFVELGGGNGASASAVSGSGTMSPPRPQPPPTTSASAPAIQQHVQAASGESRRSREQAITLAGDGDCYRYSCDDATHS